MLIILRNTVVVIQKSLLKLRELNQEDSGVLSVVAGIPDYLVTAEDKELDPVLFIMPYQNNQQSIYLDCKLVNYCLRHKAMAVILGIPVLVLLSID